MMSKIRCWFLWVSLLAAAAPAPVCPETASSLVFGVYPYLSPTQIMRQFSPLAEYLAAAARRPVELRSAPDFARFIERTRAGEYDLLFTAPHMGQLAARRDGYRPLAQTGYRIEIVVLARRDSPVARLEDLRNRSLAIGAKLSMTYQIMSQALARVGLTLEREVGFVQTASFSNVIEAVIHREADAGATGTLLWETAPAGQRAQLREIFRGTPVPGFFLLVHPRVPESGRRQLGEALWHFAQTPTGDHYFRETHQIDFRPLAPTTLERLEPFTRVFDSP